MLEKQVYYAHANFKSDICIFGVFLTLCSKKGRYDILTDLKFLGVLHIVEQKLMTIWNPGKILSRKHVLRKK